MIGTINWDRAVFVNGVIGEDLFKEIVPKIFALKQRSKEAIIIAIDSPGGSVKIADMLLNILESPDQDGNYHEIITVVINSASSAAAQLLTFGDYAIAYPHTKILYHGARYNGLNNVTSDVALQLANDLEIFGYDDSLKLADRILGRLIWVYIDLRSNFSEIKEAYKNLSQQFDAAINNYLGNAPTSRIDVVAFAMTLYNKLSLGPDRNIVIAALDKRNRSRGVLCP